MGVRVVAGTSPAYASNVVNVNSDPPPDASTSLLTTENKTSTAVTRALIALSTLCFVTSVTLAIVNYFYPMQKEALYIIITALFMLTLLFCMAAAHFKYPIRGQYAIPIANI